MKKSLLLLSVLIITFQLQAGILPGVGVDLTPERYRFENQQIGAYPFDVVANDWNVDNQWPNEEVPFHDGLFAFSAGEPKLSTYYGESISIIDLGGEVGQVFCIKGYDFPDVLFPYGRKASNKDGINEWSGFHLNFYSPVDPNKSLVGTDKTFTLRIVSKIITPTPNDINPALEWQWRTSKTGELWAKTSLYSAEFEGENDWNVTEITTIPSSARDGHFPFQFKTNINPAQLLNSVVLIKEISFIADTKVAGATKPTPVITSEFVQLKMDPATSSIQHQTSTKTSYTLLGDQLQINNLDPGARIIISTLAGVVVNQQTAQNATETIPLGKGYFTVSVDDKVFKILR